MFFRHARGSPCVSGGERGQTAFDFLVGMGVLLLAIGFVFGFIPGMFEPFSTQTGSNMVVADRSAASLSNDVLVDSLSTPGVLNSTCTVAFFSGDTSVDGCRFSSTDLNTELGVGNYLQMNVTIRETGSIRELDDTPLRAGVTPPSDADVTAAQRVLTLENDANRLIVRVW